MDLTHLWMFASGLASVALGLRGLYVLVPRSEHDRVMHRKVMTYGWLCIGGGVVLAGSALLT
jgi:hypothetical protein